MKKLNYFIQSFTISAVIGMFFCFGTMQVNAEKVPIMDSPDATVIDSNGLYLSGRPLVPINNLVVLSYRGVDMSKDITADGIPVKNYAQLDPYTVIRVKNVGYYKGKLLVFCLSISSEVVLQYNNSLVKPTQVYDPDEQSQIEFEVWVEDLQGNEILDENISFLLPYSSMYRYIFYPQAYHDISIENTKGLKNLLVMNSIGLTKSTLEKKRDSLYNINQVYDTQLDMNYIYTPSKDRFWLKKSWRNGKELVPYAFDTEFFLNKSVPTLIPLVNPVPEVTEAKNMATFKAKLDIFQPLLDQSFDSFYSNPLNVSILMPNVVKTINNLESLKITDNLQTDITAETTNSSKSDGEVLVSFNKELLKRLKENTAQIQAEFNIKADAAELLSYYQQDGYFHIPIKARNNEDEQESIGYSLVKMPAPTGEAISQTVGLNSSTKDLVASKLVKNMKSVLPKDTFTVVGFDQEKNFTTLGNTEVYVKVKSGLTGVEGKIKVPIRVMKQSKLTVTYVDEKGQSIHEAYVKSELLGAKIDLSKVTEINNTLLKLKNANYELTKKPVSEVITIVEGENNFTYQFTGVLKILSAPSVLDFELQEATIHAAKFINPKIIGKPLVVSDTRADKVKWHLKAKVDQPLTSVEERQAVMPDAIKYNYSNNELTLGTESSIIFSYLNTVSGSYDVTKERWSKGDGFFLDLGPGAVKALGQYQAKITITLENAK